MLPTPSTSHVPFNNIYEPAEDSYLFLDTLSSTGEVSWLSKRFNPPRSTLQSHSSPPPLVVETGIGSGVVLAFLAANSRAIFGREDIIALGTDVNSDACLAASRTVNDAIDETRSTTIGGDGEGANLSPEEIASSSKPNETQFVASITADLCSPLRPGEVDVLVFNPPYVPTPELPNQPSTDTQTGVGSGGYSTTSKFEQDSYFLSLSYAGGVDGMETTDRLLDRMPEILDPDRGVAYVLLCAQNKPKEVMERIRAWGSGWSVEPVGRSGAQAGWEKLVIIRIWKELPSP
ncbi:S-adenosylmethionine-dependent methyltransferase [Arachnomyces sp. PD_36]|nr:S-adenosylmethionine-dependent methyltransferase [Arachnomyces sp. PD_36]